MTGLKGRAKIWSRNLQAFALIGILVFALSSCDSIFGTDEEASITVSNQYGETLDIYMDEKLEFTLENEDEAVIEDVSLEEHNLEAKTEGTDDVVASTTITVEAEENYTWTIEIE